MSFFIAKFHPKCITKVSLFTFFFYPLFFKFLSLSFPWIKISLWESRKLSGVLPKAILNQHSNGTKTEDWSSWLTLASRSYRMARCWLTRCMSWTQQSTSAELHSLETLNRVQIYERSRKRSRSLFTVRFCKVDTRAQGPTPLELISVSVAWSD